MSKVIVCRCEDVTLSELDEAIEPTATRAWATS